MPPVMASEVRFGAPSFRVLEAAERRERVSEVVEGGEEERRDISDSMAAVEGVRSGSFWRMEW